MPSFGRIIGLFCASCQSLEQRSKAVNNLKKCYARLIFYYSGGSTVKVSFIANTIINTVELKLDFDIRCFNMKYETWFE